MRNNRDGFITDAGHYHLHAVQREPLPPGLYKMLEKWDLPTKEEGRQVLLVSGAFQWLVALWNLH